MSSLNITQPLGIWSIMATIRWCPIFPKWDSYQPLWICPEDGRNSEGCGRWATEKNTIYLHIFGMIGKRYGFLLVNHCSPLLRRMFEYDFHHFWGIFETSQVSAKLQLVCGIVNIKQLRMISWHRQWLLWRVAAIPTSVTTAPMHSMWADVGSFSIFS